MKRCRCVLADRIAVIVEEAREDLWLEAAGEELFILLVGSGGGCGGDGYGFIRGLFAV